MDEASIVSEKTAEIVASTDTPLASFVGETELIEGDVMSRIVVVVDVVVVVVMVSIVVVVISSTTFPQAPSQKNKIRLIIAITRLIKMNFLFLIN